MPLSPAGELVLVLDAGVDVTHRLPERSDRRPLACVVPHAGHDGAAVTRHARHLGDPPRGIRHEVHDQLGKGGVELAVAEGQLLGRAQADVHRWEALAERTDERLRWVDRGDTVRPGPSDELARQHARPCADVENPLAADDSGEVGHLRRQLSGVAAHETVVRLGCDLEEAHVRSLARPLSNPDLCPMIRPGIGGMDFTLTLTLGAALLAVWLDARFVRLRPKTAAQGLTHACVAALSVVGAAGLLAFLYGIPQVLFMAAVLCVFLPALVYSLLAGLWMLRALVNLAGMARR